MINPYDICCMNKMINGTQCTGVWHVDDIKASHVDKKVLDDTIKVMEEQYGQHAPLTDHRGDVHEFWGMVI